MKLIVTSTKSVTSTLLAPASLHLLKHRFGYVFPRHIENRKEVVLGHDKVQKSAAKNTQNK